MAGIHMSTVPAKESNSGMHSHGMMSMSWLQVCFNTLRVAVELSVAAGTITSPASQREYATFRSATSQSLVTATSVPGKFATGSGSEASGEALWRATCVSGTRS